MSNRKDVPEECSLGAHHTGDGWALFVANADDDVVCYLAWPEKWPDSVDTRFLIEAGFKIVDEQILEWAERHDVNGTLTDLRCMVEDAATLTPNAEVSGRPPHETEKEL